MLTQERPLSDLHAYVRPQTSTTFPTHYVGRLVFKPIMRDLRECARQEGLQLDVDSRGWVFTVVTKITVSGDRNAVDRFGWFIEMVMKRYSWAYS